METEYQISESEYVRAHKLFSRLAPRWLALYGIAVPVLIAVAALASSDAIRVSAIFGLVGGFLGHAISRHIYAPAQVRKQYRSFRGVNEPAVIGLNEEGVTLRGKNGHGTVPWQNVFRWRQNKEFVLIYQALHLYLIVPKRIAQSGFDIDGLIRKLEGNVGKAT